MSQKPYNKLILINDKPNFLIVGENNHGPFKLKVESYFQHDKYPETAIVIATVKAGKIEKGNKINIQFKDGTTIKETIKNIQIQKENIAFAECNQSIGIQLSEKDYSYLTNLNELTA